MNLGYVRGIVKRLDQIEREQPECAAFVAPLVCGYLGQRVSWHWGFAAAGVGMVLGLIVFVVFGGGLREVGPVPAPKPGAWRKPVLTLAGTLALWGIVKLSDTPGFTWIRLLFILVPIALMVCFGFSRQEEVRRLGAIFFFFIGAFVFWELFEQAGSSLSLFADRFTATHIGGVEVPSSWYAAANPIFVITLAPLFALIWTRLGNRQPPLIAALGNGASAAGRAAPG